MTDSFVLLAPLILLPIVLLFAFVGCTFTVPGLNPLPIFGQPGDIPVQGDYDGDGITEAALFRPPNWWQIWKGNIFDGQGALKFSFIFDGQQAGDIPVPGDYGSGHTEPAYFRPSDASWHIYDLNKKPPMEKPFPFTFGKPSNVALPADYLQDGRRTLLAAGDTPVPGSFLEGGTFRRVALFRQSDAQIHVGDLTVAAANTTLTEVRAFPFGAPADVLVPGDYGTGFTALALFTPSNRMWQVRDILGNVLIPDFSLQLISTTTPIKEVPLPPAVYWGDTKRRVVLFRNFDGGSALGFVGNWFFFDLDGKWALGWAWADSGSTVPVPGNYFNDGERMSTFDAGVWWTAEAAIKGT
jgi:hypothetical protein